MKTLLFVETAGTPIYHQLQIEEALLRTSQENICLVNFGSPPAIVLGKSGKVEELVEPHCPFPLIRRFSGGGTVVVDESTLFVTLIINTSDLPLSPFPKTVLEFAATLFSPFFPPNFTVKENDFALGEKKIGGNAQYFTKNRWLHHTTFLWDYDPKKMTSLKHPPKEPAYRNKRPHGEFLTTLRNHLSTPKEVVEGLKSSLKHSFILNDANWDSLQSNLWLPHRKSTSCIDKIYTIC